MRAITGIVIHCTGTRPTWMQNARTSAKIAEVRRWHMKDRGWKDIGYHNLIDRDGTVGKGRPLEITGSHTKGHNTGTIGIALFGGWDSAETDTFDENYTPQQDAALRKLIAQYRARFPTIKSVTGHNDWAAKACPGFDVGRWL